MSRRPPAPWPWAARGTGELVVEGGSEVAVGVAQGTIANNNGQLVVGGSAGGQGRVRIGGNSALLVYGNAAVGAAGASARASAAYANSAAASGPATGTITVGESADDIALFSLLGTLSVTGGGQVALGGSHATVRASAVNIAQGGAISGAGTLSGLGGGNRTVTLASIDNEGSILASGGNLLLYGAVHGTGTLLIDPNSTMTLQAAVGSGQALAFGQNATAVLNDARAFAGTITGFGSDDLLDLASTQATSATLGRRDPDDRHRARRHSTQRGRKLRVELLYRAVRRTGRNLRGGRARRRAHGLLRRPAYDFQAVGDFVAVQSNDAGNPWQVQIRTASAPGATSITTGLAASDRRCAHKLRRRPGQSRPCRRCAGCGAPCRRRAELRRRHAGAAFRQRLSAHLEHGPVGHRSPTHGGYLDWAVGARAAGRPRLGARACSAATAAGPRISSCRTAPSCYQPSDAEILGVFADAWRVKPDSSLLDDTQAPNPAPLVQAMAADLVPHGAAAYDPGPPHQDANAQANLLAPSPLHSAFSADAAMPAIIGQSDAPLSDTRPNERLSLFRRISAANAAQCASIEAKMPKCRRKNRQGGIRH